MGHKGLLFSRTRNYFQLQAGVFFSQVTQIRTCGAANYVFVLLYSALCQGHCVEGPEGLEETELLSAETGRLMDYRCGGWSSSRRTVHSFFGAVAVSTRIWRTVR